MIEIKVRSIEELAERGFNKFGDKFECVGYNPQLDIYLFSRWNIDGEYSRGFEVVKPVVRKGVRCYPSSEQFGTYGRCFPATLKEKAYKFLNEGWTTKD